MKSIIILFAFLVCAIRADIYGRLDSFEDIGYLTPKKNFNINDNVYFRTYFDKVNDTVTNVVIKDFYVSLVNGTKIILFRAGTYYPASEDVYLIFGVRNDLNAITAVLKLEPTIFDVPPGDRQATAFTMELAIDFASSSSLDYAITSQIVIGNSKRGPTTTATTATSCANSYNVYFAAIIIFCIGLLV